MAEFTVPTLLILVGIIVLIAGGEVLVRGASGMARAMHISPLVIGLTVVAFCTSCPELAVCLKAAFAGKADFAVGNIVGSCICNILLVLGLSALIGALVVQARLVWLEVPLMIFAAVLTLIFGLNGTISRVDGFIFIAFLAVYMAWTVIASRRESKAVREELSKLAGAEIKTGWLGVFGHFTLVIAGVTLLVVALRLAGRRSGRYRPPARRQRVDDRLDHPGDRHVAARSGNLRHRQSAKRTRHCSG